MNHKVNTEQLMWKSNWKDQFDPNYFRKVQVETQVSP